MLENGLSIKLKGGFHYRLQFGLCYQTNHSIINSTEIIREESNNLITLKTKNIICQVDDINEINSILIRNFLWNYIDESALDECYDKFIKSKHPLQMFFTSNGGGELKYTLQCELYTNKYMNMETRGDWVNSSLTRNISRNSCEHITADTRDVLCNMTDEKFNEWFNNTQSYFFGNNEHIISPDAIAFYKLKSHLSFPNDPLKTVIYTDSISLSASAVFLKDLREEGAAIIVGINGNPLKNGTENFDIGLAPTEMQVFSLYVNENNSSESSVELGMSIYETYRKYDNETKTIPREYLIDEIDLRYPIFKDDVTENDFKEFSRITKDVIKKFETECNPSNKRLVKRNKKCDEEDSFISKIPHMHGGHPCGEDGKWKNECVPSHCDVGFIFDRFNNVCLKKENEIEIHQVDTNEGIVSTENE